MNNKTKDGDEKTAETIMKSANEMRKAEENLPALPKDAQAAMKAAAQSLAQAAKQADRQAMGKLPTAARSPTGRPMLLLPGGLPGALGKDLGREMFNGKAWGDLSGELKTRMLQDYRARFGDDHAELIRQYFDRLNETPAKRK